VRDGGLLRRGLLCRRRLLLGAAAPHSSLLPPGARGVVGEP
jgi:hypothetical protein